MTPSIYNFVIIDLVTTENYLLQPVPQGKLLALTQQSQGMFIRGSSTLFSQYHLPNTQFVLDLFSAKDVEGVEVSNDQNGAFFKQLSGHY